MTEKTILIVDDEEVLRDMLEKAFRSKNYSVRSAESAEKALEILRKESIMVMFLDIKLPGMNGMDLCIKIRTENPVAILYALTGYTDLFGLLQCRTAGFDDFFAKPVALETLLTAAQHAFEKIERWKVSGFELT
jgi:CheY-like chemotaxis protein